MSEVLRINTGDALSQEAPKLEKVKVSKLLPENLMIRVLDVQGKLPNFDFSNNNAILIANELVDTAKYYDTLMLSHNQLADTTKHHRVFVAGTGDNYVAYFNPVVVEKDETITSTMVEACINFPHLHVTTVRPGKITVEYQDFNGENKITTVTGLTARLLQQGIDLLDGICYLERAKPLALQMAFKRRNKMYGKLDKASKKLEKQIKQQQRRK